MNFYTYGISIYILDYNVTIIFLRIMIMNMKPIFIKRISIIINIFSLDKYRIDIVLNIILI